MPLESGRVAGTGRRGRAIRDCGERRRKVLRRRACAHRGAARSRCLVQFGDAKRPSLRIAGRVGGPGEERVVPFVRVQIVGALACRAAAVAGLEDLQVAQMRKQRRQMRAVAARREQRRRGHVRGPGACGLFGDQNSGHRREPLRDRVGERGRHVDRDQDGPREPERLDGRGEPVARSRRATALRAGGEVPGHSIAVTDQPGQIAATRAAVTAAPTASPGSTTRPGPVPARQIRICASPLVT